MRWLLPLWLVLLVGCHDPARDDLRTALAALEVEAESIPLNQSRFLAVLQDYRVRVRVMEERGDAALHGHLRAVDDAAALFARVGPYPTWDKYRPARADFHEAVNRARAALR